MTRLGSKEARVSDNRYFYVMGEGWYVLTREGVSGPYPEKNKAIDFVQTVLTGSQSFDFPHSSFDIPHITQHS
jgi:hypothetical protein